jgi:hypothetical protein
VNRFGARALQDSNMGIVTSVFYSRRAEMNSYQNHGPVFLKRRSYFYCTTSMQK